MRVRVSIRAERPTDRVAIADVVQRAYADVAYSDHREHLMIDRLRKSDAYIPSLSLLAEIEGKAVGHVLLTKAFIRSEYSAVAVLALAPLSVAPECQRSGVGKVLVAAAHDRSAALGSAAIVLIGAPGYYRQFGYEPLGRYPVALPIDAPEESRMILPLFPRALEGVAGRVDYAEGWLVH